MAEVVTTTGIAVFEEPFEIVRVHVPAPMAVTVSVDPENEVVIIALEQPEAEYDEDDPLTVMVCVLPAASSERELTDNAMGPPDPAAGT